MKVAQSLVRWHTIVESHRNDEDVWVRKLIELI